jgi:hypothetical protein
MTKARDLSQVPNASLGFKNRIINGDMRIDQRNAGASWSATNGGYSLDRWFANSFTSGATTGKFTVQQNAGSVTPPAGFSKYLGVASSAATSTSAGDIYAIGQFIEGFNIADLGWGTANAQPVVISFQVRSSATGTFGLYIRNENNDYNYPTTYVINSANTWETKTVTIPAPTSGSWNTTNGTGIGVYFQLQVGSSFTATAGSWTTSSKYGVAGCVSLLNNSGATFYITGVQLEKGSTATNYDVRPYGTELDLCQRYYWRTPTTGVTNYIGTVNASTSGLCAVQFPVHMRATATLGTTGGNFYLDNGVNGGTTTTVSANQISNMSCRVYFQSVSGASWTVGQAMTVFMGDGNTGSLNFSAEL